MGNSIYNYREKSMEQLVFKPREPFKYFNKFKTQYPIALETTDHNGTFTFPALYLILTNQPNSRQLSNSSDVLNIERKSTLKSKSQSKLQLKRKLLIFYLHGNADMIVNGPVHLWNALMQQPYFTTDKCDLVFVAPEYPGYCPLTFTHGLKPTVNDSQIAISEIFNKVIHQYPKHNIVVIGRSLGTYFATWIASQYPKIISRLVLVSPFYSMQLLTKDILATSTALGSLQKWVPKDFLNSASCLHHAISARKSHHSKLCPLNVLFIHGKQDELISPSHSHHLNSLLQTNHQYGEIVIQSNADHNTVNDECKELYDFLCVASANNK